MMCATIRSLRLRVIFLPQEVVFLHVMQIILVLLPKAPVWAREARTVPIPYHLRLPRVKIHTCLAAVDIL